MHGHVMHDAGSDKRWVALTVGTTCGPGRRKSCVTASASVVINWKHLYRTKPGYQQEAALVTCTTNPEFGCDSSEGQELTRADKSHPAESCLQSLVVVCDRENFFHPSVVQGHIFAMKRPEVSGMKRRNGINLSLTTMLDHTRRTTYILYI